MKDDAPADPSTTRALARPSPTTKGLGIKLLAALGGMLLAVLSLEAGLRLHYGIRFRHEITIPANEYSKKLGWKCQPFVHLVYDSDLFGRVTYSTTRYGFRRFEDPKDPGPRLLVIGDSFTQATTASDGSTYYDVLQKNAEHVALFAYGSGGYATLQEYMVLDRYIDEIRPDIILWQFSDNDLVNNTYELESEGFHNNRLRRPYLRDDEVIYRYPTQERGLAFQILHASYLLRVLDMRRERLDPPVRKLAEPYLPAHRALFDSAIDATSQIMAKVRKRAGGAVVLAFEANRPRWIDKVRPRLYETICRENGIDFIEGVPEALEEAKARGVQVDGSPKDMHWNATGHAIVGKKILAAMLEKGLVKASRRDAP